MNAGADGSLPGGTRHRTRTCTDDASRRRLHCASTTCVSEREDGRGCRLCTRVSRAATYCESTQWRMDGGRLVGEVYGRRGSRRDRSREATEGWKGGRRREEWGSNRRTRTDQATAAIEDKGRGTAAQGGKADGEWRTRGWIHGLQPVGHGCRPCSSSRPSSKVKKAEAAPACGRQWRLALSPLFVL
jgi:hypothetical protein